MPAYREKIYFVPKKDYYRVKIVEFPIWWDRAAFFDSYGNRQIDTGNPLYVDFGLLLTSWEAMAGYSVQGSVLPRSPVK